MIENGCMSWTKDGRIHAAMRLAWNDQQRTKVRLLPVHKRERG